MLSLLGMLFWSASPGARILIFMVIGVAYFGGWFDQRLLRHFAERRVGQSICHFARDFNCRITDTLVVRATYEEMQEYFRFVRPHFPLRSSDNFKTDLRMDDEDLEDVVYSIAHRSQRSLSHTEKNPLFGKVETMRDLVLFLNAQPLSKQA